MMMSEPTGGIRVLVVEDHDLLAQSLRFALTAEGFDVTVPHPTHEGVLDAARQMQVQVALVDLDLGDRGARGDELVAPLCRSGASVIVVSATEDKARLVACLEHGAVGVLAKSQPLDQLIDAVRAAAAGRPVMQEARRLQLLADVRRESSQRREELRRFESLTAREGFVLGRVMAGLSAAQIATESFVSEATVRTQIRSVLTKLGVRSQLAAAAEARRVGWSHDNAAV